MLMHFVDPKKFDDAKLDEYLARYEDLNLKCEVESLHALLKDHLLRRMKKDVLKDLPPKKEQIVLVEMSGTQKDQYKVSTQTHTHRRTHTEREREMEGRREG